MKKLLTFAMQVGMGVDMIVAMIAFLISSFIFGIEFSWIGLGCAIIFAHLPDTDMIPYMILKKIFGVKFRLPSHRLIGHHPLLVIPIVVIPLYYFVPGIMGPYLASIALIALIGHFAHDTMEPQGFHWLSPFYWGRITLYGESLKFVPVRVWVRIHLSKGKTYGKNAASEIIERADPIEHHQKLIWWIIVIAVIGYYLYWSLDKSIGMH